MRLNYSVIPPIPKTGANYKRYIYKFQIVYIFFIYFQKQTQLRSLQLPLYLFIFRCKTSYPKVDIHHKMKIGVAII